jgi:hypothetical protein
MKAFLTIIISVLLSSAPIFSQTSWDTSLSFMTPASLPMSNSCGSDYVITQNAIDGFYRIDVNHQCSPTSTLVMDFTTKGLLLKKKYAEFRLLGDTSFKSNLVVKTKDGDSIAFPFSYSKADNWQILFFDMDSAMKAQSFPDGINKELSFWMPNGTYKINYFYLGGKAVPPVPTIDWVKIKTVPHCAGIQTVTLSGISIPGRLIDGLTITAQAKSVSFIKNVAFQDFGSGPLAVDEATNIATASLHYTPIEGMGGNSDSIIITLTDTIRHQKKVAGVSVNLLGGICCKNDILRCGIYNLDSDPLIQSIFPAPFENEITINLSENITCEILIFDATGKIVASLHLNSENTATLNLGNLSSGLYLVKISDGKNAFVKKIVKE